MEAYLTQRGKRDRFTDTEFFDACSRLSAMVGPRNITVLLAKLYAEQLIAVKDNIIGGATQASPLQRDFPNWLKRLNSVAPGRNFGLELGRVAEKFAGW
jgi:hypothetical protein